MVKEVIIPPVPSKGKQTKLEEGFLKAEELPPFEEHEYTIPERGGDASQHETNQEYNEKAIGDFEKTSSGDDAKRPSYEQIPYSVAHKVIRGTCLLAMLIWLVLIILLGMWLTTANTFIGLLPILLTIIVTYIVLDNYHLENGLILFFPFVFTAIFFILGLSNNLPKGMDYALLSTVNVIFGLLFDIVIIMQYSILRRRRKIREREEIAVDEHGDEQPEEEDVKEEEPAEEPKEQPKVCIRLDTDEGLKGFVSSIEDKAKAINAAIGRVYNVKHGGSEALRKKIRIDAEHYNEINELKNLPLDKRRILAIELLRKIKDKLDLLMKHENEVFDKGELQRLANLERDVDGDYRILDVLVQNDKDPVQSYYDGAVEFCDEALDELVASELETMKEKSSERKKRKIERAKKAIEEAKGKASQVIAD
ncbi:hypothetical protein JXB28_03375 [Candidatus Woesearchaeota archaeon]|nr:hypothetical protein [Candidatus Woesearchaeota archaeon]